VITSKAFIIFLIPLIILGFGIWFMLSVEVDPGNVRVAGALVGNTDMELTVTSCSISQDTGSRKLVVELDGKNEGSYEANLNPKYFKLILADRQNLTATPSKHSVFNPMQYSSICEDAPMSISRIPPDGVRSLTLVFWGETLPSGGEWDDFMLSLEYYDASAHIMLSKLLSPTEQ
jgi:hypothetical protein